MTTAYALGNERLTLEGQKLISYKDVTSMFHGMIKNIAIIVIAVCMVGLGVLNIDAWAEEDIWEMEITATGQPVEGVSNRASVYIGIKNNSFEIPAIPPPQGCNTVQMVIEKMAKVLTEDYRASGSESAIWLIRIEINDAYANSEAPFYYPRLSWQFLNTCLAGTVKLWSSNSSGERIRCLAEDMIQIESYQVTPEDGCYFCVNWLGDITVNMTLKPGWNMISLPVEPENRKAKILFPGLRSIIGYTTEYELLDPNQELETDKGYWIYLPSANIYQLTGKQIENIRIKNAPNGWSMISSSSFPSFPSIKKGTIKAIFGFSNKYRLLGPEEPLEPGQGYWINLSDQTEILIENIN